MLTSEKRSPTPPQSETGWAHPLSGLDNLGVKSFQGPSTQDASSVPLDTGVGEGRGQQRSDLGIQPFKHPPCSGHIPGLGPWLPHHHHLLFGQGKVMWQGDPVPSSEVDGEAGDQAINTQ